MTQYKSKLEERVAEELGDLATYEPDRVYFIQPEKKRFYLPDFKIADKVYIETKGRFTSHDRMKHVWIKEQHPEITIYILFQNSSIRLSKTSKTTYGEWATKNGIPWGDFRKGIPKEWIEQHGNQQSNRDEGRTSRDQPDTKRRRTTVRNRSRS